MKSDEFVKYGSYIVTLIFVVVGTKFLGLSFLIICTLVLIFNCVRHNEPKDQYSAYSVFNPQQRSLLGDLRGEQIEAELHNTEYEREGALIDLPCGIGNEDMVYSSKNANRECWCGSKKKVKKCCGKFAKKNED
eukprot:GHVL01024189.1.p1 GENE.GHVL01024189.1~~GHVL01024189.1.p1  ORF type:complete len:134 (+),score=17.11 GHVL01024189.1:21-422(+)